MDWKNKNLFGVFLTSLLFLGGELLHAQDFNLRTFDLPLFLINTNGQSINQNEKNDGSVRVLDRNQNLVSDSTLGSLFHIGIKIRGQTSATFPKKGYGFELLDENGLELDAPLLGMPEGSDWVLHGPYVDKTLIRNSLAHWLYRQTGRYSPRTRFAELFLNGEYKGVYLLEEKIKRGKNRIHIAKLKPEDVAADDLTGGYIWSIDKVDNNSTQGLDQEGFKSKGGSPIVMRYPKKEKLNPQQLQYIQEFINSIESKCDGRDMGEDGCDGVVDFDAAVDYMMHQEITKNTDAFICSFYMFKDKDSKGGKMQMGAPWDFNLALGAVSYSSGMDSTGWQIESNAQNMSAGDYFVTKWELNIWNNESFKRKFKARWAELRSGVWHSKTVNSYIDSLKGYLTNAAQRNFERWPNLGKASGMNDPDPLSSNSNGGNNGANDNPWGGGFGGWGGFGGFGGFGMTMNGYSEPTWDAEVEHVRRYLMARIRWIDRQMDFFEPDEPVVKIHVEPTSFDEEKSRFFLDENGCARRNYFKQSSEGMTVYSHEDGFLELRDLNGKILLKEHVVAGETLIALPTAIKNTIFIAILNGKMISR